MTSLPDISATIIFHRERAMALPALESFRSLVEETRAAGISVETLALLDRPDPLTERLVGTLKPWFDKVRIVDFGDLAKTRNAGVACSAGRYLAFFDGDDLWGANWLRIAFAQAEAFPGAVYHPEWLYYFNERDFDVWSPSDIPTRNTRAYFTRQHSSNETSFDLRSLFFNNVWTANALTARSIHEGFPYRDFQRELGRGVEDWSWNIEVLWGGCDHLVVPDTVHVIRVKEANSLGLQNALDGLLTHLPEDVGWGVTPARYRKQPAFQGEERHDRQPQRIA